MAKLHQLYKCGVCGNIVSVLHEGVGELVCCGQAMNLLEAGTVDASHEKHVPVITPKDGGFEVTVGAQPHPMEDKHYIEWIELHADGAIYRQFLKPGDAPSAFFCLKAQSVSAREYCNVHGLWAASR